jgi:hypothetical protein
MKLRKVPKLHSVHYQRKIPKIFPNMKAKKASGWHIERKCGVKI